MSTSLLASNITRLLALSLCGLEVWARGGWLVCFGSCKATIEVSSRAVFSSGGSWEDSASELVLPGGRIQFLVATGLRCPFLVGCWPAGTQLLEAPAFLLQRRLHPQSQQGEPPSHQIPSLLQISFQEEPSPFSGLTSLEQIDPE